MWRRADDSSDLVKGAPIAPLWPAYRRRLFVGVPAVVAATLAFTACIPKRVVATGGVVYSSVEFLQAPVTANELWGHGPRRDSRIRVAIPGIEGFGEAQETPDLCWAASMQLVYAYYGYRVPQERIAGSISSRPRGALVRDMVFLFSLANEGLLGRDARGWFQAALFQIHKIEDVIAELEAKRPVIVGLDGERSGHVVVIGGIEYLRDASERRPQVIRFRVFDPAAHPGRGRWKTLYANEVSQGFDFALFASHNTRE